MSTLEEIKSAISHLPLSERGELERWLHGWEDDEWDKKMSEDAADGKLDALMTEADRLIQ